MSVESQSRVQLAPRFFPSGRCLPLRSPPLVVASARVGFSPIAERLVASAIGEHAVIPGPHTLSTLPEKKKVS